MNEVVWSGGHEHWVEKGDVRLFMWERKANPEVPFAGTVFFVHGSSMASQPTFDLHVPGRANSSVMQWFNAQGFDTWTMDNEGYGRSSKHRQINCDINTAPYRHIRNGVRDFSNWSDKPTWSCRDIGINE
jgi:alpha-beta hydrolase superfamily lysophospholipase